MTYVSKHIVEPCKCALWTDTLWFLNHPDRCMNLRTPYECEAADMMDQPHVSQVIVVTIPKSLNQQAAEANNKRAVINIEVQRHSFLFVGKASVTEKSCDDEISQFLKIIDDDHEINHTRN